MPSDWDFGSRFSGKERDTETGNDYMFARYYNSATGRFLSPDWSAKEEPVPYAKLDNPQSLNLYSYVLNNPVGRADPDGHCGAPPEDGGGSNDESCGSRYSVGDVTGIVYNEVGIYAQTDDGPSTNKVYTDVAHAVYNGESLSRQPDNAGTDLPPGADGTKTYTDINAAVKCACADAKKGIDPTNGADQFNTRTKDDQSDRKFYDKKGNLTGTAPLSGRDGPYKRANSKSKTRYWETFSRTKDGKPASKKTPKKPGDTN